MNEAETRAEHIDPALKAAGWDVADGSRIRREYPITLGLIEGHGKRGKALTADYVLEYRNTKLAVVEAKAWDKPLTEGVGQAKDYAGKLEIRYTYATNGQGIYSIDMVTGSEGELTQYPTPDELWNLTFASTGSATAASAGSATGQSTGQHSETHFEEITEIKDAFGYMYILGCGDGSFYTGSTKNLRLRMEQHNTQAGARHTAARLPVTLIYYETFTRIDEAFAREEQVQGWSRAKKIALINGSIDLLKQLSRNMTVTSFWHPDGTPMSAQQFMEMLFGKLPEFFKNEEELRAVWSLPATRAKLLQGLAEKDFDHDQLAEMQKIIDAEKSDLFDVLAHVAYALPSLTREERAAKARVNITQRFNSKQQTFLDFVLAHYINLGVEELAQEKLSPLLKLKYHDSLPDAVADLGKPEEIGIIFAGFQKYLYQQQAMA